MISFSTEKDESKYYYHYNSGGESRDTGTEQSHFRYAEFSVDQNIVTYDIHDITAQQQPHRYAGIGDTIGKLLESIKQEDKQ